MISWEELRGAAGAALIIAFGRAIVLVRGDGNKRIEAALAAQRQEHETAIEKLRLELESDQQDATQDNQTATLLMEILKGERARADQLLAEERARADEARATAEHLSLALSESREATAAARLEVVAARRDSEALRSEVGDLRRQLDAQRVDREELVKLQRSVEVLTAENTRLRAEKDSLEKMHDELRELYHQVAPGKDAS